MNDMMVHGDVKPRQFADSPRSIQTVRQALAEDIPAMLEIGYEAYPNRNIGAAVPWMEWCIQSPERLVLMGSHSFGVAHLTWHYGIEKSAGLVMLASRKTPTAALEALYMLRCMVNWAKLRGAKGYFTIDSDTDVDFGPFAKRLGGKRVTLLQYHVPLE